MDQDHKQRDMCRVCGVDKVLCWSVIRWRFCGNRWSKIAKVSRAGFLKEIQLLVEFQCSSDCNGCQYHEESLETKVFSRHYHQTLTFFQRKPVQFNQLQTILVGCYAEWKAHSY